MALALARQSSDMLSAAQENLLLIRRLVVALRQRRFPCDVAPDIEWLLKQGRQLGVSAELASKLNYLWCSCTGESTEQNDLFRLAYALETTKDMHRDYRLLSNREWSGRNAVVLSTGVNTTYLPRVSLDVTPGDSGRQINLLTARLTGNIAGVMKLSDRCGWQAEPEPGTPLPHQYSLVAGQGVPRKGN